MFFRHLRIFFSLSAILTLKKGWCFMGNKFFQYFTLTIAVIGAVNWGLIGFFNFNLVSFLFGSMTWFSRIIYGLVGLCGLYLLSFYGLVSEEA